MNFDGPFFKLKLFAAFMCVSVKVLLTAVLVSGCNPISDTKLGNEHFPGVEISTSRSTLSVSSSQVAVGSIATVTLSLRDKSGEPYISTIPVVSFSASGGVSAGTLSAVTNNGNGIYSATFTGVTPGSATTLQATIDGDPLQSTLPTLEVTQGGMAPVASAQSVNVVLHSHSAHLGWH